MMSEQLTLSGWDGSSPSLPAEKKPISVTTDNLLQEIWKQKEDNAVLLTAAAVDSPGGAGGFEVYFVFALPVGECREVRLSLPGDAPAYPSVTPMFPSAHWLEREIRDMMGIIPEGHPDLRRVAVHPDWPEGVYPLRRDFIPGTQVPRTAGEMEFCQVEGEGLYRIPVGPIHAGIIEPGHFRFSTFGEEVIDLQAQLFYTHRGVEKAAEGLDVEAAALIAERVCGVCSASHAAAYAQAVEDLAGMEIPLRAAYIRTILLELERLYNHIGDIGNLCAGIGFSFGISRGAILKERVMRLNLALTGHRYLRGTIIPGGVKIDFKDTAPFEELDSIEADLKEVTEVMLSSQGLLDRMHTTGVLPREDALALGAVGPAARAAGVDRDVRRDLPYAAYPRLDFQVPLQEAGDVFCRLKQRMEEAWQSFAIVRQAVKELPAGDLAVKLPRLPDYGTGVGCTESARGADVHWVMSGPDNTLYAYRVRSASHCNWPVVPLCLPGNIVPDFPLINKSFELCYACLDR